MHVQTHIQLYRCTCACTTTVLVDLIVGVAIGVVGRGQPSAYTMAWPTEHGGIRLDGVRSARTTVQLPHTTLNAAPAVSRTENGPTGNGTALSQLAVEYATRTQANATGHTRLEISAPSCSLDQVGTRARTRCTVYSTILTAVHSCTVYTPQSSSHQNTALRDAQGSGVQLQGIQLYSCIT